MNHIDPGDPPRDRYAEDMNCHNPDPINAWQPGSVMEQAQKAARQAGIAARGIVEGLNVGALPKGRPERDGPDYAAGVADDNGHETMFWLNLGVPAELIPHHTQELLRGPAGDALQLFIRRNIEYGDEAKELGAKGQYADINRKVRKLKRLLWDENVPRWAISEDVEQVIMDLIGHCILTIDLLRKGNKDGQ